METFSSLLDICAGKSQVPGEIPTQRPVTRGFHVFFDLRLNKRLSKQLWGWWFETPSRPLWCRSNGLDVSMQHISTYCFIFSYQFRPNYPGLYQNQDKTWRNKATGNIHNTHKDPRCDLYDMIVLKTTRQNNLCDFSYEHQDMKWCMAHNDIRKTVYCQICLTMNSL